ncbi:hypothetical protein CALCODRAFT_474354 [Calocera cornea HHB12733]|uniref:RRM domain-containing protein n=1 Tax=Calocera cornea HHB12733 TaxID=1353952 RepID=A0A165DXC9_9BASI|nr:hypothetical protein CALCODRAFT_474354 [Calocera cornea HHB12733]
MSGKRVYIGKMPRDAMKQDVEQFFDGYGRILDCRIMNGFGFVEFDSPKDAEDVVASFQGKKLLGEPVIIELAKESRRERGPDERGPRPFTRRPGYRILVHGISRDTSWQDLKDFGREAGAVTFSDIDRDNPGEGILEYLTPEDQENALRVLNDRDLRGTTVRVTRGEVGSGGLGGNGADYARDREFRRSRSPSRREPFERRRSPPPRRDYDERPRYDDRDRRESGRDRYAEAPPRSAGEDRYAERPRYDDRPPRYDDRPPRDSGRNGDARPPYEERGSRYDDRPPRGGYTEGDRPPRRDDRDRRADTGRDGW